MDFKQIVEQALNRLTKKDGTPTKFEFQDINVLIGVENEKINACIASQFAKQGYPVNEYGKKVNELYGRRK